MNPVDHYIDGRDSWRLGVIGAISRIRGIVTTAVMMLIFSGVPWWWTSDIPNQYQLNLKLALSILIFLISIIVVLSLYYLRYRKIRSLNIKYYLHQLAHNIRDRQTELNKKLISGQTFKKSKIRKELEILLKEICENVALIFQEITKDKSVSVAIRLAIYDKNKKEIVYKTFARSKGLNPQRSKTSEPISIKEGIPRFLREDKNSLGILIYNDLKKAARVGVYKTTKNDELYPGEIKTMMVAPLNAWAGKQEDMIGLLFVTSRKNKIFSPVHVDQIAFIADQVSCAVSNFIEIIQLKCNKIGAMGGDHAKLL